MLRHATVLPVVLAITLSWPLAAAGQQPAAGIKCQTGPVAKTFGKRQWLVYSCADGRSIVFFSAPGDSATPFFLMLAYHGGKYRLVTEGSHGQAAAAAVEELKRLSDADIAALLEQTKAAPKK